MPKALRLFLVKRTGKKLTALLACLIITLITFGLGEAKAYEYGSGIYGECLYDGEIGNSALTFTVNGSGVTFNNLSTSSVKTATTDFSVTLNCSDQGYSVIITGSPPTNGVYTLANLTSPTASSPGTEQYGINLVDNATPNIGANPSGGIGAAASGYGTADQFKYVSGNTIATSTEDSTETDYTISFIANVSTATPATTYSGTHTLICTATF